MMTGDISDKKDAIETRPDEPAGSDLFREHFLGMLPLATPGYFDELFKNDPGLSEDAWVAFSSVVTRHIISPASTELAEAMVRYAGFMPDAWSECHLRDFVELFPGALEHLTMRLVFCRVPFNQGMLDVCRAALTPELYADMVPSEWSDIPDICAKIPPDILTKNFSTMFLERWKGALKKVRSSTEASDIFSSLPDECLAQIKDIGAIGLSARVPFYQAVLQTDRKFSEELVIKAMIGLHDMGRSRHPMKAARYTIRLKYAIPFPTWLLGVDLLKVMVFLGESVSDLSRALDNLPNIAEFRTRTVDVLLCGNPDDRDMYNLAFKLFGKLQNNTQLGMDAVTFAKKQLADFNKKPKAGFYNEILRDNIEAIINRVRDINADELWAALSGMVMLISSGNGPYSNEDGALKLIDLLTKYNIVNDAAH